MTGRCESCNKLWTLDEVKSEGKSARHPKSRIPLGYCPECDSAVWTIKESVFKDTNGRTCPYCNYAYELDYEDSMPLRFFGNEVHIQSQCLRCGAIWKMEYNLFRSVPLHGPDLEFLDSEECKKGFR